MSFSLFPQELVDLLIDESQDNLAVLRSFALTSLRTSQRARQHLYMHLSLRSSQVAGVLVSLRSNPVLALAVRKLSSPANTHNQWTADSCHKLRQIYGECRNLNEVHVHGPVLTDVGPDGTWPNLLPDLTTLTLTGAAFELEDIGMFAELLACLLSLSTLHTEFAFKSIGSSPSAALSRCQTLQELTIFYSTMNPMVNWNAAAIRG